MTTRSQKTNTDITNLLRSRHTLLWVVTREELRVERALVDAAAEAKMKTVFWDCANGRGTGTVIQERNPDPIVTMRWFEEGPPEPTLLIMRDLHKWFDPGTLRMIRNLAKSLQATRRTLVILTPSAEVPPELAGHATVIDYPLPDREEIAKVLATLEAGLPEDKKPQGFDREKAIDAAVGLTAEEALDCYSKSMVVANTIDPAAIVGEKKRVIAREKVLTWIDPDPRGLDAIGGLGLAKEWLMQRRLAFSEKARAFGLPSPKGILVVGPPGTGKSLLAKCVPTAFGMPLLRIDLGALKSKWVGESEANIRKALATAEAIAPCCLWLDEIEKALGGSGSGAADGGVSSDALGTILTWMQEHSGAVFVVATSNDVSALPPELLRKGRFDELFFVDLPTQREREEVLRATLKDFANRATSWANPTEGAEGYEILAAKAAAVTPGFTGAELAALVPDALFAAFADGERQLMLGDLITAAERTVPLSKTASEKIAKLREWAKGRCRMASASDENTAATGRNLDLE